MNVGSRQPAQKARTGEGARRSELASDWRTYQGRKEDFLDKQFIIVVAVACLARTVLGLLLLVVV